MVIVISVVLVADYPIFGHVFMVANNSYLDMKVGNITIGIIDTFHKSCELRLSPKESCTLAHCDLLRDGGVVAQGVLTINS